MCTLLMALYRVVSSVFSLLVFLGAARLRTTGPWSAAAAAGLAIGSSSSGLHHENPAHHRSPPVTELRDVVRATPSHAPTVWPTQVHQTRLDMVFTVQSAPQTSLSNFKAWYRPSLEAAVIQWIQMPQYDLAPGDVMVLDVLRLDSFQQSHQYAYESGAASGGSGAGPAVLGALCNRTFSPSSRRNEVDVKISIILENAGYSGAQSAFSAISSQLAAIVDSKALENATNVYITQLNSAPLPLPLSISCFYANFAYSQVLVVRTGAPTSAPTPEPYFEQENHTVSFLVSGALFAAVTLLAIVAVFEKHFDRSKSKRSVASMGVLGNVAEDASFYGHTHPSYLGFRLQQTPLDALMEAVHIIKSAVPYMEWIRHIDFMMFHGMTVSSIGDRLGLLDYLRYVVGAADSSLQQCIWLQHRYLSFLVYVQDRSRVARVVSAVYFGVVVLCFVCLLVLYREQLPPGRFVANDFALECIIYCSITAFFSSALYGPLEASIFYVFGESEIELDPVAVSLSGDNPSQPPKYNAGMTSTHPRITKSAFANRFFSRKKASVRPMSSSLRHKARRAPTTPSNRFSRSAASRRSNKNLARPHVHDRIPARDAARESALSLRSRAATPHPVRRRGKATTKKIRSTRKVLVSHAFLPAESLLDELLRLQQSVYTCRQDLHAIFVDNRDVHFPEYGQDDRRSVSDVSSEAAGMSAEALADAALAVQFDAIWGLGDTGKFLDSHLSFKDVQSYFGKIVSFWYKLFCPYFIGYRDDVAFPRSELMQVSNPTCLQSLADDLVQHRRSVLNERLRDMADVVSVQSTSVSFETTDVMPSSLNRRSSYSHRVYYLSNATIPYQARRRVVQLFNLDVLPPLSASIVKGQIDRHKWATVQLLSPLWARLLGSIVLGALFVAFVFIIYFLGLERLSNKEETTVLIVYSSWLVLDAVAVSTVSLWVRHALIPYLAHADMLAVMRWLIHSLLAHHQHREATPSGLDSSSQSDTVNSRLVLHGPWEEDDAGVEEGVEGDLEAGINRIDNEMTSRLDIEAIVAPLEESLYVEDFFSDARRPEATSELQARSESDSQNIDVGTGVKQAILGEIVTDPTTRPGIADFNSAAFAFRSHRMAHLNLLSNGCSPENFAISLFQTIWPRRSYFPVGGIKNQFGRMLSESLLTAWIRVEPAMGAGEEPSVESGVASHDKDLEGVEADAPDMADWLRSPSLKSSSLFKVIKQLCFKCVFVFVEYLPLVVQDWLIELSVWGVLLWLIFLHVYTLHTIPVLVIFPALLAIVVLVTLFVRFLRRFEFGAPYDDIDHVLYYPEAEVIGPESENDDGSDEYEDGEDQEAAGQEEEEDRHDDNPNDDSNRLADMGNDASGHSDDGGAGDGDEDDDDAMDISGTVDRASAEDAESDAERLRNDMSMHSEVIESEYSEQVSAAAAINSDSGYTQSTSRR